MVLDVEPFGPPTLDWRRHGKLQILSFGVHRDDSVAQFGFVG
jgi:hypothetical protein